MIGKGLPHRLLMGGIVVLVVCGGLFPYRFLALDHPLGWLLNYFPLLLTLALAIGLVLFKGEVVLTMLKEDVLLGAVIAFLVADLLAGIGGVKSLHSLSRSAYYFLTGPMMYWVVSSGFRGLRQPHLLLTAVSLSSGLAALYGISEFVVGQSWLFQSTLSIANSRYAAVSGGVEFSGRILGTVGHPVAFGAFLLLSLPASLHLATGQSRARLVGIFAVAAVVVAMALTFSRGTWLGLAVAAVVWVAREVRKYTRSTLRNVVVLGALLTVVASGILTVRGSYSEFVQHYDENPRVLAYKHTAALLPEHLMNGSGVGTFRWLGKPLGSRLDATDSTYLTRLIDGGVLGLATLTYLLMQIYRYLGTMPREGHLVNSSGGFAQLFLPVFVGVAVDMMTFDLLYWPATRSMFWIQVALAMGTERRA